MDTLCQVCNEPWNYYGAQHGDMAPWEFELFKRGAGGPWCQGETPEGADPGSLAYKSAVAAVIDGPDDASVTDQFVALADGTTTRPKWERPMDPTLWECSGCSCSVYRDLDTNELRWSRLGVGMYNLPYEADCDPPEAAPYTVGGEPYCPVCAGECDSCGVTIFRSNMSHEGKVLYGDTYDEGASFASPLNMRDTLCTSCCEEIPSCAECGEHWHDYEDAVTCCAPESDDDDE